VNELQDPGLTVIGGVLPDHVNLLETAMRRLRAAHFSGQVLPQLFALLGRYLDMTGEVMTRQALAGFLEQQRSQAGTIALYLEIYDSAAALRVSDGEFSWAVERLRELASEQATGEALSGAYEILTRGADSKDGRVVGPEAARQFILERFAVIDADLNQAEAPEGDIRQEKEQILARYAATADRVKRAGGRAGVALGIDPLDSLLGGGLQNGELAMIAGYTSSGKSQPLDARVLTPYGWRRMGDLLPGDEVSDPGGQISSVTGVFPQGVLPVYRLTFADGSSCEASADHLWVVDALRHLREHQTVRGVRGKQYYVMERLVLTTRELQGLSRYRRPRLVSMLPLEFPEAPLPVDPYLLGLLLGDGSFTSGSVKYFSADSELVDSVRDALPESDQLSTTPGVGTRLDQHRIIKAGPRSRYGQSAVKQALVDMGLFGHDSVTKFVPDRYKWASSATRLAVLQGLMDTDGGWCQGAPEFSSASVQLRDDVVWLARSLGLVVTYSERKSASGKQDYRAWIRETLETRIFRLSRKLGPLPAIAQQHGRVLRSVEYSRDAECRCISVSASSHMYVTDDLIPTHNTSLCVSAIWNACVMQGRNVVVFTSETLRHQVINKLVSRHSRHPQYELEMPDGIDSARIRSGTLSGSEIAQYQDVLSDLTGNPAYGRPYVAQLPFGATLGQLNSRLLRVGHLFEVHLVVIDYLGLLRADRKRDASHEETAQLVKDAKGIAATFNGGVGVPVISPWQVNRPGRERALRDGSYSGVDLASSQEAANTPDVVITLLEPEKIENPRSTPLKCELLKNRDGPRGVMIQLKADYATSCFRAEEQGGSLAAPGGDYDSILMRGR
jgi:replicative DNA helicase